MNTIIQSQLDRVESALTTLIDSIGAYNPSIPAANNLLVADDELQRGLRQLAQHQTNHARILALHDRISQQNADITATLTSLADTRTNLLSISTSLPSKDTRNVPYNELLNYAKRISRNTVPSTFRPPLPPSKPPPASSPAVNGDAEPAKEGEEEGKGMGTEALDDDEKKWLEPLMQIPFVPWVSDDVMRRGALAQIQAMVERGEDPVDAQPEGASDEQGVIEGGDEVEATRQHGVIAGNVGSGRDAERRQQMPTQETQVFGGLDLYDPTNPDEDD